MLELLPPILSRARSVAEYAREWPVRAADYLCDTRTHEYAFHLGNAGRRVSGVSRAEHIAVVNGHAGHEVVDQCLEFLRYALRLVAEKRTFDCVQVVILAEQYFNALLCLLACVSTQLVPFASQRARAAGVENALQGSHCDRWGIWRAALQTPQSLK